MKYIILILIFAMGAHTQVDAQDSLLDQSMKDDGIPIPVRAACKGYNLGHYLITEKQPVQKQPLRAVATQEIPGKTPLLKVHGNVLYDLNYRSKIDTPYSDREVYQHTIKSYLDITFKDNYPFRVFLTTRFSNSSLFRNYTDLNLQYNANDFNNKVRRQVQSLLQPGIGADSLLKLRNELAEKEKKYYSLQNWVSDPGQLQRLVAAREDKWLRSRWDSGKKQISSETMSLPHLDQFKQYKFSGYKSPGQHLPAVDSAKRNAIDTATAYLGQYDSVRKKLDTLKEEIADLDKRYRQGKELQNKNTSQTKKEFEQITSGSELKDKLKALHISDSSLPKGYQTLFSVKSFGIGKTMLDYSELSAKNVSITGMQIEYTPSCYVAVAAGTVDYRFRDYTVQNASKGQYIGLFRYGRGRKEGNNVILTYYTGRRQLYNSYTTVQGADIPNYNLMGVTVEGRYKISRTSALVAEIAKSSSPYYSLDSSRGHNVLNSALKMNDRTNEAYSLKFSSFIPYTQTQFNASYRHFGANFQSFSLFTSGSEQSAWSVRVDQSFFRRHLQVTGSVRTNDFTNPLLNASYKSSTVFKSIQATLRLKKWPTLSAGYFPSSQITKISENQFQENLFYTLTASASHIYTIHGFSTISMLMYTQFYNKMTDTNFVYFNTKNLLLSQSAFIGDLTLQLQLSAAISNGFSLDVIDNKVDYKLNSWLSLGAGIKYNRQTVYNIEQWGYSGNATIRVPKLGEFRLMADKGFIPGSNRQLVANKLGRLTYLKIF